MKKIILFFVAFLTLPVRAEVIAWENNKELFIDEVGLYRYRRAEEIYRQNCHDSPTEEIRSKCMVAEKSAWERGKTPEEIQKQGTLFTGKIKIHSEKGKEAYFYVKEGKKENQIRLLLNRYYFENDLLYDIKTEFPFSGEIVIGGVEGLSSDEKTLRYIAQQKYEEGQSVGQPRLILVEE